MKKYIGFLFSLLLLLFTSGCWDQRLLKDTSLILGTAFDLTKDKKILETVTFPKSKRGLNVQQHVVTISSKGDTTLNVKGELDQKLPDRYDASKNRIFLFGESLAKQGIYPVLDAVYRDPKGPLQAKLAVVDGSAKKALSQFPPETPLSSEYLPKLLKSTAEIGVINNENVQSICTIIFSEGEDFLVPYLKILSKEKRTKVTGLAMFHKDKFVGKLGITESKMFLLMKGNKKKKTSFTIKVHNKKESLDKNFISVDVIRTKRKLLVSQNKGKPYAKIKVNIKLEVKEYPEDHLDRQLEVTELNKKIEKSFREMANLTLKKMKVANCDGLGIGSKVQANEYNTWKNISWDKEYQELPIKVELNTEIVENGVIN
ncbi:Ger(x)C family spore germination protein [Peribacillus aracenensis]|uniref:Ger(x)C family spore germination protein n=1 Tax=Peribacillus aracenensis TaxID=2976708 RepID=UPI0021A4091D|nr:Ger(x)C family spore germination protein [Peribacillus sp. BBB004]